MLSVYRIFSYVLLPIAAFLGLVVAFSLLMALSNLAMLLPVFIMGATVLYVFVSFSFLKKGIDGKTVCKASLKDLIKVNGYVAVFFSIVVLVQTITFLGKPLLMQQSMDEAMKIMSTQKMPNVPTTADMMKAMKSMLYLLAAFSAILLAHVFMTFKLLKEYAGMFGAKAA